MRAGLGDWQLAAQFDCARASGAARPGDWRADTWGLALGLHHDRPHLDLYAAVNVSHGAGGAFPSLGGGPFFTTMEDVGIDALGGPGRAWLVSAAHPWRHGARRWRLTLAAGGFRGRDGSAFDRRQLDTLLEFGLGRHLRLTAVATVATVADDRSPADVDDRQFRLIADLDFR